MRKEITGEVLVLPKEGGAYYGQVLPKDRNRLVSPVQENAALNEYGQSTLPSSIEIPQGAERIPFTPFSLKMHGYEITFYKHPNFGSLVTMGVKRYMNKLAALQHGGYHVEELTLTAAQEAALQDRKPVSYQGIRGGRYR